MIFCFDGSKDGHFFNCRHHRVWILSVSSIYCTVHLWFMTKLRVGNSLIGFLSESLVLSNKKMSDSLMVALFWWATWAICSHRSFLVSDLSESLTSLIKKEGMSELLVFKQKTYKKYDFSHIFWANCSFFVSKRVNERFAQKKRAIRSFAHLSWATWATWVNRSRSLICHGGPERFAHSCSFVLGDLSKLLTVTHLI